MNDSPGIDALRADPQFAVGGISCEDCKFGVFYDTGWSNYTVEGTVFICGAFAHPCDDFDVWYGGDPRLNFAPRCPAFVGGDPVRMDVDHEDEPDLSDDQRWVWDQVSALR